MSAHHEMTSKKAELKQVLRDAYPASFLNVAKHASDGKTYVVPPRAALAGTRMARSTTLIVDLSIYANMFMNVTANPDGPGKLFVRKRGSEFVRELTKNVDEGFSEGYRTIVLLLDKQVHTTAAKQNTQKARSESAEQERIALGAEPLDWTEDAPYDLVTPDGIMEPMCRIKTVRAAFRYAIYQAMRLALPLLDPPAGCRVCIDVQPYHATNPATDTEWLNDAQIYIPKANRALVERLRARLYETPNWRAKTRRLSTELGRAGVFSTLPWCVEKSPAGVLLAPRVLPYADNTCGEADHAAWRYVQLFFGENIYAALRGPRMTAADSLPFDEPLVCDVGPCSVATTDSDFISGGVLTVATLVCDYAHTQSKCDYETLDRVGEYAPFLLIGESHVLAHGYATSGSIYGTSTESGKPGGRPLKKSYELVDLYRLFCSLVFNRHPYKRARDAPDDETVPLTLPPYLISTTTPHTWLRRALSFSMFRNVAGNDFVKGLGGVSYATMWKALVLLMHDTQHELVHISEAFLRPHDAVRGALPSQSAVVPHPEMYVRLLSYSYWQSIAGKGGSYAPREPAAQMTLHQLRYLISNKWKAKPTYHVPDDATILLMFERSLVSLFYEYYGPTSVRRTLDETLRGWSPGVRHLTV